MKIFYFKRCLGSGLWHAFLATALLGPIFRDKSHRASQHINVCLGLGLFESSIYVTSNWRESLKVGMFLELYPESLCLMQQDGRG